MATLFSEELPETLPVWIFSSRSSVCQLFNWYDSGRVKGIASWRHCTGLFQLWIKFNLEESLLTVALYTLLWIAFLFIYGLEKKAAEKEPCRYCFYLCQKEKRSSSSRLITSPPYRNKNMISKRDLGCFQSYLDYRCLGKIEGSLVCHSLKILM